jgi:hypothetical protein
MSGMCRCGEPLDETGGCEPCWRRGQDALPEYGDELGPLRIEHDGPLPGLDDIDFGIPSDKQNRSAA